jgi:hypothetical protein
MSSKWSIPFRFSNQNLVCISPMCATRPVYLILMNLITLTTFVEVYTLRSSSLCSLLQPPSTSSLLVPIFSSPPCFQTPSIYIFPLVRETKFHTHTKQQIKL